MFSIITENPLTKQFYSKGKAVATISVPTYGFHKNSNLMMPGYIQGYILDTQNQNGVYTIQDQIEAYIQWMQRFYG